MQSATKQAESVVPTQAELITIKQAAVLVQVSRATVRSWCRAGKIRRYGEGRIWRVRREELLAFLEGGSGARPRFDAAKRAEAILSRFRG